MKREHIIIISPELKWSAFVAATVRRLGYTLAIYNNTEEALDELSWRFPSLVVFDDTYVNARSKFADRISQLRFVVFAVAPSIDDAIVAYRAGALDYAGQVFDTVRVADVVNSAIDKPAVRAI
jgi:DNA-binding NtrC family response regulator